MSREKYFKAKIVNGPSREELIKAFQFAYGSVFWNGPKPVVSLYLTDENLDKPLEPPRTRKLDNTHVHAMITGLSYNDVSGKNFTVSGYIDYYGRRGCNVPFSGSYSADTACGCGELKYTLDSSN